VATFHKFVDGREAFKHMLGEVHAHGDVRSPRGLKTFDLGYTTLELLSPFNALAIGMGRQLSKRVAAAEAIQLIGGFSDPQLLLQASPNFSRYIEPSGEFWGAYGGRIALGAQLPAVVRKLTDDPDTRQAVVTLWNPHLDNQVGKNDYPCTIALGFSIRHRRLELDVTMRSNDVWRGLPYDLFQFTQLQLTVANVLGVEPGHYRHHTYSLHLYAEDVHDATNVYLDDLDVRPAFLPVGFGGTPGGDIEGVMLRAHGVASGRFTDDEVASKGFTPMDPSERWYFDALYPAK
jgi:thymidylate synthase